MRYSGPLALLVGAVVAVLPGLAVAWDAGCSACTGPHILGGLVTGTLPSCNQHCYQQSRVSNQQGVSWGLPVVPGAIVLHHEQPQGRSCGCASGPKRKEYLDSDHKEKIACTIAKVVKGGINLMEKIADSLVAGGKPKSSASPAKSAKESTRGGKCKCGGGGNGGGNGVGNGGGNGVGNGGGNGGCTCGGQCNKCGGGGNGGCTCGGQCKCGGGGNGGCTCGGQCKCGGGGNGGCTCGGQCNKCGGGGNRGCTCGGQCKCGGGGNGGCTCGGQCKCGGGGNGGCTCGGQCKCGGGGNGGCTCGGQCKCGGGGGEGCTCGCR